MFQAGDRAVCRDSAAPIVHVSARACGPGTLGPPAASVIARETATTKRRSAPGRRQRRAARTTGPRHAWTAAAAIELSLLPAPITEPTRARLDRQRKPTTSPPNWGQRRALTATPPLKLVYKKRGSACIPITRCPALLTHAASAGCGSGSSLGCAEIQSKYWVVAST